MFGWSMFFFVCVKSAFSVRFKNLDNNHLQIRGIRKADEGVYTCEARIMARGEIDFRDIRVVVNGELSVLLFAL